MRAITAFLIFIGQTSIAFAESVVAQRTIPAHRIITEADLATVDAAIDGAIALISLAVGQEARNTIYAGRPVLAENLAAPALIERNQMIDLVFQTAGLSISAEGRALQRGGRGDTIRALNLASKVTVSGRIGTDGRVYVGDQN